MSLDVSRRYAGLKRMGIHGYGGTTREELTWWWKRALCGADFATLDYFAKNNYPGWELTPSSVRRYGGFKDVADIAAKLKDRPLDKSRMSEGSPRVAPEPKFRFKSGFGFEVSVDDLSPTAVTAFGGRQSVVVFIDPGHRLPFVLGVTADTAQKKGDSLVPQAVVFCAEEYRRYGHHQDEWGVPITDLRMDYGAGFISAATKKVLRGYRIGHMFSTPHCHAQNGVAENCIGQLFRMVTACFVNAKWAPRMLWMFALQYVVLCYNLRVGEDGQPAWEAFYGDRYNFKAHPLLPWGCIVLVFVPKEQRSWKFGAHAVPGMYVGTPMNIKEAIYVYIPLTKRVRIVRQYVILEKVPREWPVYGGMEFPSGEEAVHAMGEGHLNPSQDIDFEDDFADLVPPPFDAEHAVRVGEHAKEEDVRAAKATATPAAGDAFGGGTLVGDPTVQEVEGHAVVDKVSGNVTVETKAMLPEDTTLVPSTTLPSVFVEDVDEDGDSRWEDGYSMTGSAGAGTAAVSTGAVLDPVYTPVHSSAAAAVVPEMFVAGDEAGKSVASDLLPVDAGPILPPTSPEDRLPTDEVERKAALGEPTRLRMECLVSHIPELRYVLKDTTESNGTRYPRRASPASMVGQRRVQQASPKHVRFISARVQERAAAAEREKARQKRVYFQEVSKASAKRRKNHKRTNPDKPSLYTALRGPYRQKVLDAMALELEQYTDTFEAVRTLTEEQRSQLSKDDWKRAITSHYEIEYKRDPFTGELVRVKARLVIHGNQTEKYDYDDIKSPTARTAAVKLLFAMSAKKGANGKRFLERGWDVKSAFLQNKIRARVAAKRAKDPQYVEPGEILLRLPDGTIAVMQSYCYGLKQASYEWFQAMREVLVAADFVETNDPCIFHIWEGEDIVIVSIHVDDVYAISTSDSLLGYLDTVLSDEFDGPECPLTRSVGPKLSFLKMTVNHCEDGTVTVDQEQYINKIISEWGYGNGVAAAGNKLLVEGADCPTTTYPLQASYTPKVDDGVSIDSTWYRGVVGALNYAAQMTRPDLLYTMSVLAAHSNNPTRLQKRMLKRVMKYLVTTRLHKLVFRHDDDWEITAWADASYASREEARSQSGYCFALGRDNATFYAKSQKQSLVTLSSTEAEYVALHHTVTEIVYLRRFMEELGFKQPPTVVFQDNQSTILWAKGKMNHHRTKHLLVKYHYVQQLMQDGVIEIEYLPTDEMRADLQTKPLLDPLFTKMTAEHLGM